MYNITTVISYCSRSYKFLKPCIQHIKDFSDEIIIPVSDHFFNGDSENCDLINKSIKENPEANFLEFEWNPSLYKNLELQSLNDPFTPVKYMVNINPYEDIWFWNQLQRCIGWENTSSKYILFIDADEICHTERFLEWLNIFPYEEYNSIRFDSFFYFLQPSFQSKTTEEWNGITIVKKEALSQETFFLHSSERLNFINFVEGKRKTKTEGLDGMPLWHHYSWVGNKQELLKKTVSWSHNRDRNWEYLIEKEFERDFNPDTDTCFVHNYNYKKVVPYVEV